VFFLALDSGKCLQTESFTNLIKIYSVIRFIHKIVKSDLPASCLTAWNDSAPTWRLFMKFIFWKICWENERFIKVRQE